MASVAAGGEGRTELQRTRLVIGASSVGTVFEWYDFFIYGTLAASGIIGRTFFPAGNETLQTLLAWAGFAVGFGFRPLGAILFGYLGDKLGRKYTFLVTVTLMGIATAGVGMVPTAESIGLVAPAIVIGVYSGTVPRRMGRSKRKPPTESPLRRIATTIAPRAASKTESQSAASAASAAEGARR